ncbi:O-antigen ligase family protein [Bradyrhizobium sp. DN5]|uniref:O-antigen ligase family protein n=1 Tax=Bradyrhizobium sp. DN5 TaxID=3056950 RepID=UPI00352679BC
MSSRFRQNKAMALSIAIPVSRRKRSFLDLFSFWALILLSGQGLLNYLLGQSALSPWKQLLLMVCFLTALLRIQRPFDFYVSIYVLASSCALIVSGSVEGVGMDTLLFNSFYYVAWLPFYLTGTVFDLRGRSNFVRHASLLFLLIGAIGLVLQLYTPFFDFLKDQEAADIRSRAGETQRFGFIFVTSTLVMPTLAGMYFLYLRTAKNMFSRAVAQASLVLAVLPTGSLAGLIMLLSTFGMIVPRLRVASAVPFLVGLALLAAAAAPFSDDLIDRQLQRMTGNTIETASNQTRLGLWQYAVDTIANFPIEMQVFGAGLGVTNSNRAQTATYAHGESSFFQALIEGGLVGLTLRILPFFLLLSANLPRKDSMTNWAYGLGLFICCAAAPLFGGFGLQCLLGFNAGLSQQIARRAGDR